MFTDNLIVFTLTNNKRVVISADAIESIEESTSSITRISTRHTVIEVSMSFDEVMKVLSSLVKQTNKRTRRGDIGHTQNP